MKQTYLEDTVSLSQNTNKLGVVTVHIPLANPSMTNTDHLYFRGHGMMWKTNLLSMMTSQKMKDLDRFGPPSMFYMFADILSSYRMATCKSHFSITRLRR